MKLAEALIARANCQERISQLKERLIASAKVQDGDAPPESPVVLFAELDRLTEEMGTFIRRINRTNAQTAFEGNETISDALATRDMLQMRQNINRQVARASVIDQNRYSRSEIRFVSTVDIASLLRQADEMSKKHRELDARIQGANWSTELVD
jgi:hypothetical protein